MFLSRRQSMWFDWLIYTVGKFYDILKIRTFWSSLCMTYPTKRVTKRKYEKKFLFNFPFVNESFSSRVFPILNIDKNLTWWLTLYLIFRVYFHISVNQFCFKFSYLKNLDFHTRYDLFSQHFSAFVWNAWSLCLWSPINGIISKYI